MGYVLVRLATSAMLVVAVTVFVFVAFFALPRNTPRRQVDPHYRIHGSMLGGYAHYVWRIVAHGDLGRSYANREPVTTRLVRAAPVTLSLVVGGLVLWLAIFIPLGLLAALRPRSALDRTSTVLVLVGFSAHPLWLGLLASWFFGHYLHVLPGAGYCSLANLSTGCDGLTKWTMHLILPWFVFALVNGALFTTMVRALVIEELELDYVRTARATGAGTLRIVRRHVVKNVALPVITMLALNVGTALAAVVFIETAFNLPGLGGMLRQSTLQHDLPMIAGSVLFLAIAIVVLNLLVDLAYVVLDPRIATP